jgi:hypothetical protein
MARAEQQHAIARRIACPCLAPEPRLLHRSFEFDSRSARFCDLRIEIGTFEIHARVVSMDRQRRTTGRFEPGVFVAGAIHDQRQSEAPIEISCRVIIAVRQDELVEPHIRPDIQTHVLLPHRAMPVAQAWRLAQCETDERATARDRFGKRTSLGQSDRNRTGQRAAGPMGAGRFDACVGPRRNLAAPIEQPVGQLGTFAMPPLHQQRARRRLYRRFTAERGKFGQVRCRDGRNRHQPFECRDRRCIGEHRAAGRDHDGVENDGNG